MSIFTRPRTIGSGIMIDHATGVVIGETASIADNVSMLHSVSLGGSGCGPGRRHPAVEEGVLIAAGAKLLGPIRIGTGAKIAAGSVVLADVPAHGTVAGVPARLVGGPHPCRHRYDSRSTAGVVDGSGVEWRLALVGLLFKISTSGAWIDRNLSSRVGPAEVAAAAVSRLPYYATRPLERGK